MGWCHEFGSQIVEGCAHPMVAGAAGCRCGACGGTCAGRFAGCPKVWARGPRPGPSLVVLPEPSGAAIGGGGGEQPTPGTSVVDTPVDHDALRRTNAAVDRLSRNVRRLTLATEALPARLEQAVDRPAPAAPAAPAPAAPAAPVTAPVATHAASAARAAWGALAARPEWRAARERWRSRPRLPR